MNTNRHSTYDVGILGWWYGKNYGSILTYYSLNRAIESLGYRVLMVHETLGYDKWRIKWPDDILSMQFARRVGYTYTQQVHYNDLDSLNDKVDTFLVGSDQLWNPLIGRVNDDLFLDFVRPTNKKIAYATSFGNRQTAKFKPDFVDKHSPHLKRFDAISVREKYGIETANDVFGVAAEQVVDPVFLLPRSEYEALADTATITCDGDYLALFLLDPTPDKMRVAEEIAKKLGFEKILVIPNPDKGRSITSKLVEGAQYEILSEDAPENFLHAYRNAGYVITDSFHGTAFSVIFEKPFSSIYNTKRGTDRFVSLKTWLQLGDKRRIRETDTPETIAKNANISREIDLTQALKQVDTASAASMTWLSEALATKPAAVSPPTATQATQSMVDKVSTLFRRTARFRRDAGKALAVAQRMATERIPFTHLSGTAPTFESNNNGTKITKYRGVTRITVPENGSRRGHHIWCDLPVSMARGDAYQLRLRWSLRTRAKAINLHLRNPQTGKFRIIGTVRPKQHLSYNRWDTIDFIVPESGLSQFMLGALHLSGKGAEAHIVSLQLKKISRSNMSTAKPTQPRDEVAHQLALDDHARFVSGFAAGTGREGLVSARSRMMFHSHAIEKGLSHNDLRPGFGRIAVPGLAKEMNAWVVDDRDTQDVFYQTAASVMKNYFDRHREIDRDVSHFHKLFDASVIKHIDRSDPTEGGVLDMTIPRERHMRPTENAPFMDVVYGRRSIREFTNVPVDDGLILEAAQIAMQAPSVCNRQSGRVHVIDDPKVMKDVLAVQGGYGGYAMPPKLLLVTSNLSSFLFVAERNQPYIDGGLFMMNLLLGLTHLGLGSCSLNTAMNTQREAKIRKRLGIPDNEVFIAFVAVGHFDPSVLTPRSKRLSFEDIIIRH